MVDGTKVQIGNDVLLDVGVNSDWYISSVGYSYDPKEVTISLRKKEAERSGLDIIREIIEDKADVESVVRWIPCSERLPSEGEVVLVCMRIESHKAEWEEQRTIEFGRISSDRDDCYGTGWEWLNESGADYWEADWNNSILAWMPLPKPWKGADDE